MNNFLSFFLVVFLMLGAVGCANLSEQQQQKSYEEQKALYADIISQYTELLTAKHSGKELHAPDTENMNERECAIAETLHGIVDVCKDAKSAENLGYGYRDLDDNGTPELILLNKDNSIKAIFTVSDDAPILLEAN